MRSASTAQPKLMHPVGANWIGMTPPNITLPAENETPYPF